MEEKSSSTLPRLFAPPSQYHPTQPHPRHHHQELWQGDLEDFDVEEHAQSGRFSEESSGSSESTTTSTSTSSTTTTRKPSWSEIFSVPYLKSKLPTFVASSSSHSSHHPYSSGSSITGARSRSMSLPPYHRLPQRPPSSSSSSQRRKGGVGLRGLPAVGLSSIPRRYYKPKLLCILILATILCIFYRELEGEGFVGGSLLDWVGADEAQLQSGMSLLRGSISIGRFKAVVGGGAAWDSEKEEIVAGEEEEGKATFKIDGGGDPNDPPLYPEYFAYEESLIQHHLPASSSHPPKKRYIHYANHNYLLGFNNHLEEYLLNAHLAFLANRTFVAHEYTWNPNWESEPFSDWNGRKIPSRVPESVVLGGWLGGAVRHDVISSSTPSTEESTDDLTPVSRPYYDSVCPTSDRVYVNAQEVMDAYLSEYVDVNAYPGIEGQKVGQADGMMVLKAWVERLNREDVRDAKCVEVKSESGHAFDFWLFGSPRLHALWPSLVQSPALQHWSFSPLIYGVFQRNLVDKAILGESVKRSIVEGLKKNSKDVNGGGKVTVVDGIEYDEFGYPAYPSGYSYPPIHNPSPPPSSSSSSLESEEDSPSSSSSFPFTQRNVTVSPYPRTPDSPLPILALHLRRGDFLEHCVNLAEWGSEFMGFVSFKEFSERDGFVPPSVDESLGEDAFSADDDEDDDLEDVETTKSPRKDVAKGTVLTQLSPSPARNSNLGSKPKVTSSSSSFRGHRFSDTDPRTVNSIETKKRFVIGTHCYPNNKQIVKRVQEVVHDWVGGRYVNFVKSFEESQLQLGLDLHNAGGEYERALERWKEDTLRRLKAIYVMTNGDKEWAGDVRNAVRRGVKRWDFRVEVDVGVSVPTSDEDFPSEGHAIRKRVLEWTVDEWPWDLHSSDTSGDIVITTARDLELRKEEKYVAQAVDMYIGQRSEVFIGNGFSSMTANVAMLRKKDGLDSVQTRFW